MKNRQWIILGSVVLLSFLMFTFLGHVPEMGTPVVQETQFEHANEKMDILKAALSGLPADQQEQAKESLSSNDFLALAELFEKNRQIDAAGMAYIQAGKDLKEERDLYFVAKKLVNVIGFVQNPEIKQEVTRVALDHYKGLRAIDSTNSDYVIGMAGCYIEGLNDVMTGVSMLKDVLNKDPRNLHANFQLGRLGIVSGQFDKAVKRLEIVVQDDPKDVDALLYMAEAFKGLGQNNEAIKYLKLAAANIEDVEVKQMIEKYIKELIN